MSEDAVQGLVEDVQRRYGPVSEEEALHAIDAVMDSLGELLSADEAHAIAACVPPRLGRLLEIGAQRRAGQEGLASLVAGVSWRENVDRGLALEHVTAVCEALAGLLPNDLMQRLHSDLPSEIAALLERRRGSGRVERTRAAPPLRPPNNLATGRPGSQRPIADSHPETAHSESLVRARDPHADTKLSAAKGLTQERLGESLANGKPR